MTIASAELKYFGEVYHTISTVSYEFCMDTLARNRGLKVVPVSQDIEVTEESDFDGPDFKRFSTSIGGFDYKRIIETMFKENGIWCFIDSSNCTYSLGNEDLQYLEEYYAEEMYKFLNGEPQNISVKA